MIKIKTQYANIQDDCEDSVAGSTKIDFFRIPPEKLQIMKKLSWVVCLSFLFMVAEGIGGYFANSLAVMSDAAHLFSDVCGYALSLVAVYLSTWPKSKSMPYGFVRAEIIGALCSVLFLWVVLYHLVQEGIERLTNPEQIDGKLMFVISSCGLLVNLLMGFILVQSGHSHSHGLRKCDHVHDNEVGLGETVDAPLSPRANCDACQQNQSPFTLSMSNTKCAQEDCTHDHAQYRSFKNSQCTSECGNDHMDNMNIRAAYIHVLADTLQSFGVVVSSALIWFNPDRFAFVDPICTLIFAIIGFGFSLNIMKDIGSIFMLRSPENVDVDQLREELQSLDIRILGVEDLRVLGLTANEFLMTCRISTRVDGLNKPAFFEQVNALARKKGIQYSTVQVENISVKKKKFSLLTPNFI